MNENSVSDFRFRQREIPDMIEDKYNRNKNIPHLFGKDQKFFLLFRPNLGTLSRIISGNLRSILFQFFTLRKFYSIEKKEGEGERVQSKVRSAVNKILKITVIM